MVQASKEYTCRRIYSGSKSFWKRQTAVDLSIFEHRKTQEHEIGMTFLSPLRKSKEQVDDAAIIELVVFDPDNGVEQHLFMSGKLMFGKVSGAFNQRGQSIRVQQFSSYANSLISKYIYARVDLVADGITGKIVTLIPLNDDVIDEYGRLDVEIDKPSNGLGVLLVIAQYRRFKTEDWDATVEQFNNEVGAVSRLRQISSDALEKTKDLIEEAEDISGVLYKKTFALETTVSKLRQISSDALGEDENNHDNENNNQNSPRINVVTHDDMMMNTAPHTTIPFTEIENQPVMATTTVPTPPHQPMQRPSPAGQPKHRIRGVLSSPSNSSTHPSNDSNNLPLEGAVAANVTTTTTTTTASPHVPTSSSTGITPIVLIPTHASRITPPSTLRDGVVSAPQTVDTADNDHDHDHDQDEQDDAFDEREFDDEEEDEEEEEEEEEGDDDEGFEDPNADENNEGEIRQSESTLPTPTPSESQRSANAAAAAAASSTAGKRKKSIELPQSASQGTKKSMGGGVISMLVSAVSAAMKGGRKRANSPSAVGTTIPAVRTSLGTSTNTANRSRSPALPLNSGRRNSRNNTPQRPREKDRDITPQRRLEKKTTNGRRPVKGTKSRTASFVTSGGDGGHNHPQPPTGAPPSRQKKNPITIGRFHTADF